MQSGEAGGAKARERKGAKTSWTLAEPSKPFPAVVPLLASHGPPQAQTIAVAVEASPLGNVRTASRRLIRQRIFNSACAFFAKLQSTTSDKPKSSLDFRVSRTS
jgi:hypothetical protein